MSLETPQLDGRRFDDLLAEARRRIPRYTPEYSPGWTDLNPSDPGVTLLELFAWLTESMLWQMNNVPERNYVKFLELLNFHLEPPAPATTYLCLEAQFDRPPTGVPAASKFGAPAPDGGETVIFETEAPVDLITAKLGTVCVDDGQALKERFSVEHGQETPFTPFGEDPQPGSALYLGFDPAAANGTSGPSHFPGRFSLGIFMAELAAAVGAQQVATVASPLAPLDLVWEYQPRDGAERWLPLRTYQDDTMALTRDGCIVIEGPRHIEASGIGRTAEPRFWLRCRVRAVRYRPRHPRRVESLKPNTVPAINLSTIEEEDIGVSTGLPEQHFNLNRTPVQPETVIIESHGEPGAPEKEQAWRWKPDLAAADPDAHEYSLDPAQGTVTFGDGRAGAIPPEGALIVARRYRYGGGKRGNVAASAISHILSPLPGVESVTNPRAARGGKDMLTVEELKREAPRRLRHRDRAVTGEDFEALAERCGGVLQAHALARYHPGYPEADVPGAVTVFIVPDVYLGDDREPAASAPRPDDELLRHVARILDQTRVVTAEIYVAPPEFDEVRVEAEVLGDPARSLQEVARDCTRALNRFLVPALPVADEPDGGTAPAHVEFGRTIHLSTLRGAIEQVAGVRGVQVLRVYIGGHLVGPDDGPVRTRRNGLFWPSAQHRIDVIPDQTAQSG